MKYPYMPLFQGDLLAKTLHLSTQEFGAYMLLILHAWTNKAKVVVKDAQRISRVGNRHWAKVRDTLAPFFDPPDGLRGGALEVVHSRVQEELTKAAEISNKRKDAAMQMHELRRGKGHANGHASTFTPNRDSSVSREGKEAAVQMQEFRDKGPTHRAPPAKKSGNVLAPLPNRRTVRSAASQSS